MREDAGPTLAFMLSVVDVGSSPAHRGKKTRTVPYLLEAGQKTGVGKKRHDKTTCELFLFRTLVQYVFLWPDRGNGPDPAPPAMLWAVTGAEASNDRRS